MADLELAVGQRWGLWVYEDAYYQKMTIVKIAGDGRTAYGKTDDGNPCAVGRRRLLDRGDLLEEAHG